MEIRPVIQKETYDQVMDIAKNNSIIKVDNFESALTILLSLWKKTRNTKGEDRIS